MVSNKSQTFVCKILRHNLFLVNKLSFIINMGNSGIGGLMEIKIIDRNVIPDRVVLYERDSCGKSLVFTCSKINDGVNLEALNGYLEVEKDTGGSDRYLLEKVVGDKNIYFSLPINLNLTWTSGILTSQVVFENQGGTEAYRSKIFYIDVKYSVDGESDFEKVVPTVISQLEEGMSETLEECKTIKSEIEEISNNIQNDKTENIIIDAELSLESENPVTNKVITEALNQSVKYNDYVTATKAGIVRVNNGYGTSVMGEGTLGIARASGADIDAKVDNYKPIVPMNLNYAVKRALTDPTVGGTQFPKTWSDEDKLKAKTTLGVVDGSIIYKHTISFTAKYLSSDNNEVNENINVVYYSENNQTSGNFEHDNGEYLYVVGDGVIGTPVIINKTNYKAENLRVENSYKTNLKLGYGTYLYYFLGLVADSSSIVQIENLTHDWEEV